MISSFLRVFTKRAVLLPAITFMGVASFVLPAFASFSTISPDVFTTLNPDIFAARILPDTLPNGRVGVRYEQRVGFTPPLSSPPRWALIDLLPPGVTYTPTDVDGGQSVQLSGYPTTVGRYVFRFYVTAADGRAPIEKEYTIKIDPMEIGTSILPSGRVGVPYAQTLSTIGGDAPYRWNVLAGNDLPEGLTLDTNGLLHGVPVRAGIQTANLNVTDAIGRTAGRGLTIAIEGSALAIETASLPSATVGSVYVIDLRATGGMPGYGWTMRSGTLPSGMTLGTDGRLAGSPTAAGDYAFTVDVTDAASVRASKAFTVRVTPAGGTGGTGGTASSELTARLNNFARIGVSIHSLVKLPDDGNRFTQADSAVYYLGADGKRHAFPHEKVFFTWYSGFSGIRVISASDLATIPLGANATYKPGVKMVKFQSSPSVYVVAGGRVLRLVASESAARELYGSSWNRQIDDISDAFYPDYNLTASDPVTGTASYNPTTVRGSAGYVSDTLPL